MVWSIKPKKAHDMTKKVMTDEIFSLQYVMNTGNFKWPITRLDDLEMVKILSEAQGLIKSNCEHSDMMNKLAYLAKTFYIAGRINEREKERVQ